MLVSLARPTMAGGVVKAWEERWFHAIDPWQCLHGGEDEEAALACKRFRRVSGGEVSKKGPGHVNHSA